MSILLFKIIMEMSESRSHHIIDKRLAFDKRSLQQFDTLDMKQHIHLLKQKQSLLLYSHWTMFATHRVGANKPNVIGDVQTGVRIPSELLFQN